MGPRHYFFTIDNLFNEIFNDFDKAFQGIDVSGINNVYRCPNFPPVNVHLLENKDIIFEFAMAGFEEDEIEISFSGNYMILKTSLKVDEDESKKTIHKGLRIVDVDNEYLVPSNKYKTDEAKAVFKNGILKVTIPAKEEVRPKAVKIISG